MLTFNVALLFILALNTNFKCIRSDMFDQAETELTMTIKPRTTECFYQFAKTGEILEIEFQVVDSSFGEMDINNEMTITFYLYSPQGRQLIADYQKPDAIHRHDVKEDGDYKFCFDNEFSHFATKSVYFEVYVDSDSDDIRWDDVQMDFPTEISEYTDSIEQIKESINKVRDNLNKMKHFQDQKRAIEARDRSVQEHNFTRVNFYSILAICVMLCVGAVQVLTIRSLFEDKSKLHKIFKLLS
ncbi:transmembrane emp24 domain-containing protein 5-like [Centruroides sculpturatus]|uniref:transmembrane emp24 domain-containing protein 5-like n=1 Tax=Centruroides sculpturatus TaxID=218467 RepID=UPI000C6D9860|nr:transmembrane emp24 domain-containing protein 5-like [Centruroides sculpturatus]